MSLPDNIRNIWADAFRFYATFEGMGNTPEDWGKCYETALALCKKYEDHPLITELLVAVYVALDEQRNGRKEGGRIEFGQAGTVRN